MLAEVQTVLVIAHVQRLSVKTQGQSWLVNAQAQSWSVIAQSQSTAVNCYSVCVPDTLAHIIDRWLQCESALTCAASLRQSWSGVTRGEAVTGSKRVGASARSALVKEALAPTDVKNQQM
jgi:hypothetical protein